jgi:hypothetical protein
MGKVLSLTGDQIEVAPVPPISRKRQGRIREVQKLHDTGWRVADIAQFFHLSVRTIYTDLKDGKAFDQALLKALDQTEVIGREVRLLEAARRTEWRAYQLETNPFVRVATMRNIISIHEKLVKLLQGVGVVTKVPEQLDITSANDFADDEVRAAYYQFLLLARRKREKMPFLEAGSKP